jgi:hypothetical protein
MTDASPIQMKQCTKCGEEKPATVEYFRANKKHRDGFRGPCKACISQYNQQYRQENADYYCEYNQQYRQDNIESIRERESRYRQENAERIREYKSQYYRDNLEHERIRGQRYRQENRGRIRERESRYRQENAERIRERQQRYRQKKAEYIRERERQYRQENFEHYRRYRQENAERIRQNRQRHRQNNPELYRIYWQRRRTQKRSLPNAFTVSQWEKCLNYFGHHCATCGKSLTKTEVLTTPHADHWIAITDSRPDNPGTTPDNMVCLCRSCNSSKFNKNPIEWVHLAFPDKAAEIIARIEAYFEWVRSQDNPT